MSQVAMHVAEFTYRPLGMLVEDKEGLCTVVELHTSDDGKPGQAEKIGVQLQDVIVTIQGHPVGGVSFAAVTSTIKQAPIPFTIGFAREQQQQQQQQQQQMHAAEQHPQQQLSQHEHQRRAQLPTNTDSYQQHVQQLHLQQLRQQYTQHPQSYAFQQQAQTSQQPALDPSYLLPVDAATHLAQAPPFQGPNTSTIPDPHTFLTSHDPQPQAFYRKAPRHTRKRQRPGKQQKQQRQQSEERSPAADVPTDANVNPSDNGVPTDSPSIHTSISPLKTRRKRRTKAEMQAAAAAEAARTAATLATTASAGPSAASTSHAWPSSTLNGEDSLIRSTPSELPTPTNRATSLMPIPQFGPTQAVEFSAPLTGTGKKRSRAKMTQGLSSSGQQQNTEREEIPSKPVVRRMRVRQEGLSEDGEIAACLAATIQQPSESLDSMLEHLGRRHLLSMIGAEEILRGTAAAAAKKTRPNHVVVPEKGAGGDFVSQSAAHARQLSKDGLHPKAVQAMDRVREQYLLTRDAQLKHRAQTRDFEDYCRAMLERAQSLQLVEAQVGEIMTRRALQVREKTLELRRSVIKIDKQTLAARWNAVNEQRRAHIENRGVVLRELLQSERLTTDALSQACQPTSADLTRRLEALNRMIRDWKGLESIVQQAYAPSPNIISASVASESTQISKDSGVPANRSATEERRAARLAKQQEEERLDEEQEGEEEGDKGEKDKDSEADTKQPKESSRQIAKSNGGKASDRQMLTSPRAEGAERSILMSRPTLFASASGVISQDGERKTLAIVKPKLQYRFKPAMIGTEYQLPDKAIPQPYMSLKDDVVRRGLELSWRPPPDGTGMVTEREIEDMLKEYDLRSHAQVLTVLHRSGWDLESAKLRLQYMSESGQLQPADQPEQEQFSQADVEVFEKAMSERWKDFSHVAKELGRSSRVAIVFYYKHFKLTEAYSRLKPRLIPVDPAALPGQDPMSTLAEVQKAGHKVAAIEAKLVIPAPGRST